jgi:hypothetical protein
MEDDLADIMKPPSLCFKLFGRIAEILDLTLIVTKLRRTSFWAQIMSLVLKG